MKSWVLSGQGPSLPIPPPQPSSCSPAKAPKAKQRHHCVGASLSKRRRECPLSCPRFVFHGSSRSLWQRCWRIVYGFEAGPGPGQKKPECASGSRPLTSAHRGYVCVIHETLVMGSSEQFIKQDCDCENILIISVKGVYMSGSAVLKCFQRFYLPPPLQSPLPPSLWKLHLFSWYLLFDHEVNHMHA